MSENNEGGIYQPEEELDEISKMSYLHNISHRLELSGSLKCAKENGVLSTEEIKEMAKAIIDFTSGVDTSEEEHLNQYLNSLRDNLEDERKKEFDFLIRKTWSGLSKTQVGMVIANTIGFQFEGDPHIGTNNGVVYLEFYKDIYHRLPDPHAPTTKFSEDVYKERELESRKYERKTAPELYAMLKDDSENGTMVPEYQRSDQQWSPPQWTKMVDSMLRDIPMPTIILGKAAGHLDNPWQLIDGNQRMSTIRRFIDDEDPNHFTFHSLEYDELPTWARKRYDEYEFTVEFVIAKSDRELASLYERYNASGKPMSQPQIRVAQHHEISALHHYLLAMAGGPMLTRREAVRARLGISEHIESRAARADSLRKILPQIGSVTDDERLQLRKVTEKVYDLWCRIVAYCTYRDEVGQGGKGNPTAKMAIDSVFPVFKHSTFALPVVDKLDYIIRECSSLYGDFAFLSMRAVVNPDILDEEGKPKVEYVHGKSVHGWASQVQCAGIWKLDDDDLSLLKHNPDTFQSSWHEFVIREIAHARQNSGTIWAVQEKWQDEVLEMLNNLKSERIDDEDSPRRQQLLSAIEIALSLNDSGKAAMIEMWEATFHPVEFEYMIRELEERS